MNQATEQQISLLEELQDTTQGGYELDIPPYWYEWTEDELRTYI